MSNPAAKLRPFTDALRAKLATLAPLGCAIFDFPPGQWAPCDRFWRYSGNKLGMVFCVRNHRERTFVFRLE
jgi:hypothetical protein